MASAGINLLSVTVATWLLYFWAPPPAAGRPVYLEAGWVGLLLTWGRLWDAVIDPWIGQWSDGLGRRRPFLWVGAPMAVLALVLLCLPPAPASGWVNGVYFLVVTVLFYTALSLVGIPYDATLPEVAPTPLMRVALSTWKNILGTVGVLAGAILAGPLFAYSPLVMAGVLGVVGLGCIWWTAWGLPEEPTRAIQRAVVAGPSVWRNGNFLRLAGATLLINIAYGLLLSNLPYYVTLVAGMGEAQVSLFQGAVIATMIGCAPLWNWLARRVASRRLLLLALVGLAGVGLLGASVRGAAGLPVIALLGPFLGGYFILVFAMMGSVVDEEAAQTGLRREALYYGAFSLAAGLGPSLAALILPWCYGGLGYSMGAQVVIGLTGLFALGAVVVFWGYGLDVNAPRSQ